MSKVHLSKRLLTVSQQVQQVAQSSSVLLDVGSDHAYLPAYCLQQNWIQFAIAGEVAQGPYERAKKTVEQLNLTQAIDVRLGDGLSVVNDQDDVHLVTICGMGGLLIRRILEDGRALIQAQRPILILQPNLASHLVRDWLVRFDYCIEHETILEEKGHYYEIIVAHPTDHKQLLTETQLLMGPSLIEEYSPAFLHKWHHERKHREAILQQLDANCHDHQDKIQQITSELTLINQVIGE